MRRVWCFERVRLLVALDVRRWALGLSFTASPSLQLGPIRFEYVNFDLKE